MNKKDFENIRGKKIAIHCETEELAKQFIKLAYSFGFSWGGYSIEEQTYWNKRYIERKGAKGIHYCLTAYSAIRYGDESWYDTNGYKIIKFKGENTMIQDYKLPQIELIKYDEKKRTTVVKFKDGKIVIAKCDEKDTFDKFTGLMVCLNKYLSGASNQQFKRWLRYTDKKVIK